MNSEPRPRFTDEEKRNFYAAAAKRFKAELKLYGATAAIHIENKNDEMFWRQVLQHAYPMGRFRFIASSRNIGGNITSGCTQCLQYRDFLDPHFWIAIDSDYRYLTEEADIDANHYILQTYTYSFENHYCYAANLNRAVREVCDGSLPFDFTAFLTDYSRIIYPLFVWQLYLQGVDPEAFPKSVFHRLLSLPVGARATFRNGAPVLQVLKERTSKMVSHFRRQYPEADPTWYEARCNALGVNRSNAYLFVRGHQLYDLIVMLGHKICQEYRQRQHDPQDGESKKGGGLPNFERVMTSELCFGEYDEIRNIISDAHIALGLK
ncbi:MAG: DUF4435 domain-containing protein [Bacteroidales bacterium]|nr:DUF4435 domain-containing protein [Candidatus Liminaster caballi]